MKYTVLLSRQAERFYNSLEKEAKAQVRELLLGLENDAYTGKRLHGELKGHWSLRIGKLRAIYVVLEKDQKVHVVAIGHRKTLYK